MYNRVCEQMSKMSSVCSIRDGVEKRNSRYSVEGRSRRCAPSMARVLK